MANKFPIGRTFQRLGRFSLDETSFYKTYEEALDYASNNKSAYIGQHIFVKDARTEKEKLDLAIKPYSEFYFVTSEYGLEPICCFSREALVVLTFLLENAQYKTDMTDNLENLRYLLNLGNATVTGPEPPPLGNCKITIYMLPTFNEVKDTVDGYVDLTNDNGENSTTATLTPLGEVKVTNSNISSLFTETYFDDTRDENWNTVGDVDLIGRTLNKYSIEDNNGNSINFVGSDNYLFIEFGPCHFSTFKQGFYGNGAVKRIKIKEGFVVNNTEEMFYNCSNVEIIDGLKYIDTSEQTSLKEIFYNCKRIKEIDISSWDVTLVETMCGLFDNCNSLISIGDISSWIPYNLRNTARMFKECNSLEDVSVWHFDTDKITDMSEMFYNCSKLKGINVSSWDVSKVTNMSGMFSFITEDISSQVENWTPKNIDNLSNFLRGTPIESIDLSSWPTSCDASVGEYFEPTNMSGMFADCTELISVNLSNWNSYYTYSSDSKVDMSNLFSGCSSLTDIDITDWVQQKGSRSGMFRGCTSISDFSTFINLYSNCLLDQDTDISYIFSESGIVNLEWNNITVGSPIPAIGMLASANELESITMKNWRIDKENYDANYYNWWYENIFKSSNNWPDTPHSLGITSPKLKTVDMSGWYGRTELNFKYLNALESVNLSCDEQNEGKILNLTTCKAMFSNCTKLKTVNLKNVNLGHNLDGMFMECANLTSIIFDGCTMVPLWDYTITAKNVFYNCLLLERENISMVGCSDEFVALIEEAFANRYTWDETYDYTTDI